MALRTGARKKLSKSLLFLFIRTLGWHLWGWKSFYVYKRENYLQTKLEERHPAIFSSTSLFPPNQQLLCASCIHASKDRSESVHTLHYFPQCVPEIPIMKETTTKFPYIHLWKCYLWHYIFVREWLNII